MQVDEVDGVGRFIEPEALAAPNSNLDGEDEKIAELRNALAILDQRILASGYSDLLLRVEDSR
jgi:adenylate cyclase class IV